MKTVTSKDNPLLKSARKLHTRKGREASGAFLVTGKKLISEAASAGFTVEYVFVDAAALARGEIEPEVYANEISLEERLFLDLAGTVTPQPYIAVVKRPVAETGLLRRPGEASRNDGIAADDIIEGATELSGSYKIAAGDRIAADDIIEGEAELSGSYKIAAGDGKDSAMRRIMILDRVGDPGNVGMIIRSAFAAGMDGLWCVKGTADVFSDKAIRASAGAVFRLPVREGLSAQACISDIRALGVRLLVCTAGGADLYETALTGGIAFVIGNEGSGPQEVFLRAADASIGIPMETGAESLNAAVAASVVMYEARRQWIASPPRRGVSQ